MIIEKMLRNMQLINKCAIINEIEKRRFIIRLVSLSLLTQFYIIFALGYLNITPRLYNYEVIHKSAIAFTVGFFLLLTPTITNQVKQAINDKYYAATLLIFLAITYELAT